MDKIKLEIYGASHSKKIGVKIKGLPKGLKVDYATINDMLFRRKASISSFSTTRIEPDTPIFVKGIKNGRVKGQVVCEIENTNFRKGDYNELKYTPRPSHADYSAFLKYKGKLDMSGGGPFSGRLTAMYCVSAGIAKTILTKMGITVKSYISQIGKVKGVSYKDISPLDQRLTVPSTKSFELLDESFKEKMEQEIIFASQNGDSVGGIIETVISGNVSGLGGNFFDCLEGAISSNLFAVPAVKGVEFGAGFNFVEKFGSQVNDEFYFDNNGDVKTKTNNNGGINGGIANGMPICFSTVIKPTPSISLEQNTINLQTKQNVKLQIKGRHDSCIVPRAVVVVEAVTILAIADQILKENLWKNL